MEDELFSAMAEFRDEDIETVIENENINTEVDLEIPDEIDVESDNGLEGSHTDDDNSSLLFSFASTLVEDGVLPSLDLNEDKIKTTADLIEAIRTEIKSNEFADLTPVQKEAVIALRNGISLETFVGRKQQEASYEAITSSHLEEDLELRKQLIKQDFLSKGYSEDKAEKFVQRSLDLGEDLDDAREALEAQKQLVKLQTERDIENNKQKEAEAAAEYAKQVEQLKNTVYNESAEIIPGMKFNKNIADQVYESMTKIVDEVQGQPINKLMRDRMKDPVGFEHKLHYLYTVTKGFTDFTKLTRNEKTKAVKTFEENLKLNTNNNSNQFRQNKGPDLDLDFLDRML